MNVLTNAQRTSLLTGIVPITFFDAYPVQIRRQMLEELMRLYEQNEDNMMVSENLLNFYGAYEDNIGYFGMNPQEWNQLETLLEIEQEESDEEEEDEVHVISDDEGPNKRQRTENEGSGRMIHQFPLFFY